ncbi:LOW QUALITY PROTEIN: hypothetical protein V1477_017760 [Vespula maculifrons]|uniref:Uncharacterized protein n=1 Tax=Vespula maculifrons TaxID=7453 RepID=A0ABD2B0D8_VESMC
MGLPRILHSNDPGPVFLGAIVSEKKIVKENFFFHLFPSNRYNSAPIVQILIKKILACRQRISHSNDPGLVFLGATVSEKKIKIFFPLFPLNHYNSAPIGQILINKYGPVGREEPFPVTPVRLFAREALSSDPGPGFVGSIVSEKKIVTKKFFFPLIPLNGHNSVPIACRARRALSNDLGTVFLEAILSEKKIVKEKFFFHLFPSYRYNAAPIGQILI